MNISKLTFLSALVAASAVTAQTTHFAGSFVKDPAGAPYSFPLISGSYDLHFNNTTGAIQVTGSARTFSTSVSAPGPAFAYGIDTIAILQGATVVQAVGMGASPTLTVIPVAGGTKTRTQADYTFGFSGTLAPSTTYHFEFLQGGSKIASTADFTTPALVPEPETYAAAAALGLVGFGLWRRRNA